MMLAVCALLIALLSGSMFKLEVQFVKSVKFTFE